MGHSIGDGDGGLSGERAGDMGIIGGGGGRSKTRLRTMSRGQSLAVGSAFVEDDGTSPFWASVFSPPRLAVSRRSSPGGG